MVRRTSFYDIALATLLAAGMQAVILMVMIFVSRPVDRLFDSPDPGHLRVDREGQAVFEQPFGGFRDLTGRPLDDAEARRLLPKDGASEPWLSPVWLYSRLAQHEQGLRPNWRSRLRELRGDPHANWFVVHSPMNDGQAYMIGFDTVTKELLGYLGERGFRTTLPPADERFPMAGLPTARLVASVSGGRTPAGLSVTVAGAALPPGLLYLAADKAVWEIVLQARRARVLFESPSIESLAAVSGDDGKIELLVRTSTEVIAIDLQGQRRASWKIPAELQPYAFQWYELADGTALATVQRPRSGSALVLDLTWLDRDGRVTKTDEIIGHFGLPVDERGKYLLLAALLPTPLVLSYMVAFGGPLGVPRGEQPDFPTALAHSLADAWPALVTLYLVSAALAWLAYRRQVRYALSGAGTWAVFVFLLGVPGWLAYRWHRRWPLVVACGECHRPAPRDREQCAACGQLFAPPPPLGTEVLVGQP